MSITKDDVLKMDLKSIFTAVKDPATSKEMQNLMRDRAVASRVSELMLEAQTREAEVDHQLARVVPPSTEALAAEAVAMVEEPVAAVETVVEPVVEVPPAPPAASSYEAEDAALKAVSIVVIRDAKGGVVQYTQEYQVRDEDGTPIGRPTRLWARTLPELISKQREAHENATRAFHRLKKQKLTFKQEKTILTPEAIAEAARVALEAKDSSKVADVIHAAIENEYQKRERDLAEKEAFQAGRAISNEFMRRHLHDFNPCEANQKAISEYFTKHELEFTLDNLEAAFQDLKEQGDKLAKAEASATVPATEAANPAVVASAAAPVPAIPAPAQPATETASAAPAQPAAPSQPAVEATAPTPAAAHNAQPAARRPGVSGGIAPGSLSAQRPGATDPALARKDFLKMVKDMDPKIMKTKLKTDPQFVKQLESYGIRVR